MRIADLFKFKARPTAGKHKEARKETTAPHLHYSERDALLARVGKGKENAYRVASHADHNGKAARAMRAAVQDANQHGDIIINEMDGAGYYRPDLSRPEEAAAAIKYLKTLEAQAKTINKTVDALSTAIIEGVTAI